MPRRILRLDGGIVSVAQEARFDSEEQLHRAVAEHPEALPSEDVGVGPLVAVANELDLGSGPMDLLAVDAQGRLVIVEFKRGTENPDVRKVVAQVLDYGSSLWRLSYEDLDQRSRSCPPGYPGSLAEHAEERLRRLGEAFDEEAFRTGVGRCLESGNFVFLYVGRDLDERTRRIMTFLAEGARMTFFAVEVDHFHAGDAHTSVLVPRTAFVPSWVSAPGGVQAVVSSPTLETAPPELRELVARMDMLALEMGLSVSPRKTGRAYLPKTLEPVMGAGSGVGLFASQRGMEVNLSVFRHYGENELADRLLAALSTLKGVDMRKGTEWPDLPAATVNDHWERAKAEVLIPYFEARQAHVSMSPVGDAGKAGLA